MLSAGDSLCGCPTIAWFYNGAIPTRHWTASARPWNVPCVHWLMSTLRLKSSGRRQIFIFFKRLRLGYVTVFLNRSDEVILRGFPLDPSSRVLHEQQLPNRKPEECQSWEITDACSINLISNQFTHKSTKSQPRLSQGTLQNRNIKSSNFYNSSHSFRIITIHFSPHLSYTARLSWLYYNNGLHMWPTD